MELSTSEEHIFNRILRNINREIAARGIKQEVLADMMGIRQNHLSEKLHGKNGLKLAFVIKLCSVLDISIADIFELEKIDTKILTHERTLTVIKNTKLIDPNLSNG
jgi:transcriptional regulator with XRE-family HTH domain